MTYSLRDTGKAGLDKLIKALHGRVVSVGIHAAEGAEPHKDAPGQTVAEIGGYHEFGFGVPRRSFIADWFDQNYQENHDALFKVVKPAFTKPEYLDTALTRFAAWAVGQVQARRAAGIMPELAPSTLKQKARHGHAKEVPLINTGQMRASIRGRIT